MSSGTLVDRSVAGMLADVVSNRGSGILQAVDGKLKRLICVENGLIVHAASNLIEEQFDEYLVRQGLLSPSNRVETKLSASRSSLPFLEQLVEDGHMSRDQLDRALAEHAASLARASLSFEGDGCRFSKGKPNLTGKPTIQLSVIPLFLDHVKEHPASVDEVRVRIGPPDMRPQLARSEEPLLEGLELNRTVHFLLRQCDGTAKIPDLLRESPGSREETLRMIYGLLSMGLLAAAKEEVDAEQPDAAALTRDECLARIQRSEGADYYTVLGLSTDASTDDVRSAYYVLARRYHPDRFRSGLLQDLLEGMEHYFARVTEAYNTLFDPELRQAYDDERTSEESKKEKEPEQDTAYLARENYARAKLLIDKRRYADAVTFLENAIQLAEGEATYHLALGQVLARNPRRRADAETHLQRAAELDPTSPETHFGLGELYRKAGRDDEAARAFSEVLDWDPGHEGAKQALAEMGRGGRRGIFGG